MTEQEYKNRISEKIDNMARELSKGNEIEIRTAKDGIAVYVNERKKLK